MESEKRREIRENEMMEKRTSGREREGKSDSLGDGEDRASLMYVRS